MFVRDLICIFGLLHELSANAYSIRPYLEAIVGYTVCIKKTINLGTYKFIKPLPYDVFINRNIFVFYIVG